MPDFKKNWPELVFKILMAIVSVLLGTNQYSEHQEHKQIQGEMQQIQAYFSENGEDPYAYSPEHTDLLQGETH